MRITAHLWGDSCFFKFCLKDLTQNIDSEIEIECLLPQPLVLNIISTLLLKINASSDWKTKNEHLLIGKARDRTVLSLIFPKQSIGKYCQSCRVCFLLASLAILGTIANDFLKGSGRIRRADGSFQIPTSIVNT